jgi:hypothetical protein
VRLEPESKTPAVVGTLAGESSVMSVEWQTKS